ncbi:hypothetical protein [Spirillospora sp. CA-128828]|uniref:hypothetical protein n=1 Tax=Spirillospora sp. CA-128828 TaxID=3240033 RepID=UPI003D8BC032
MKNLNDLITWLLKNGSALSLAIPTCGSECAKEAALKAVRSWDYDYPVVRRGDDGGWDYIWEFGPNYGRNYLVYDPC